MSKSKWIVFKQEASYEVVEADSAEEALEASADLDFDTYDDRRDHTWAEVVSDRHQWLGHREGKANDEG